jgi:hypothetical protein
MEPHDARLWRDQPHICRLAVAFADRIEHEFANRAKLDLGELLNDVIAKADTLPGTNFRCDRVAMARA